MNISLKRFLSQALIAALACSASNAYAATVVCSGTVEEISYHQPGILIVRLSSMNLAAMICSTDSDWLVPGSTFGNTTPSACKTMYSVFLAAKLSKGTINNMYLDGDAVPATCSTFGTWTKASVRAFNFQ